MRVSAEDLRALREAGEGSELVMYEGKVAVHASTDLAAGEIPGALPVITRNDLITEMRAQGFTDKDLEDLAGRLTTAVSNRGG